jgi:hypothetical protein
MPVVAIALPFVAGTGTAQASGEPITVTVTPAAGLVDGQSVAINVKSTAESRVAYAEARVCRFGIDYQPSSSNRPAADFDSGNANCPDKPISSSADSAAADNQMYNGSIRPEGQTFALRVGTGTVGWKDRTDVAQTLTCDDKHPCALVVELQYVKANKLAWVPFVQKLQYLNEDPIAGCGGKAPGALTAGGSGRMTEAWINWTVEACKRPGQVGALTQGIFSGEGDALTAYSTGNLDLTYTAAGYDGNVGLVSDGVPKRASIAVPVAINASVMGVAGGTIDTNSKTVPYKSIKLTTPEVTRLLSGFGESAFTDHTAELFERNPEMREGSLFADQEFQVASAASAEMTSWLMTGLADRYANDLWVVPDNTGFGSDAGKARGVTANFGLASPSFNKALSLLSARSSLRQKTFVLRGPGGAFVLTDHETATAFGMTSAAIQNGAGAFVLPTEANMRAAVPTMKANGEGMLIPDITTTATDGAATAYPLTFVEYALVPAEPLMDLTCTPRTASQAALTDWLTYITTTGQQQLPAGMVALTDGLRAQAAAAIAKVGTAPVTGECKSEPPEPTTTTTTTSSVVVPPPLSGSFDLGTPGDAGSLGAGGSGDGGSTSDVGGGSGSGSGDYSGGSSGLAETPPAGDGAQAGAEAKPQEIALAVAEPGAPDFAGNRLPNTLVTVVALIGIVLLVSLATRVTSGAGLRTRAADPPDPKPEAIEEPT